MSKEPMSISASFLRKSKSYRRLTFFITLPAVLLAL